MKHLEVGGRRWRYIEAGDAGAAVVVLLHGFPEHGGSWTLQLPELSDAGWHVCAPDLPGFGGTDSPSAFDLQTLAWETAAFLDQISEGEGVHLVGHDWGGIIAHAIAANHPTSVRSLAAACAPHPAAWRAGGRDPLQLLRSSYVGVFQIPAIEHLLGAANGKLARSIFPGATSEMNSKTAVRNGLSYYRANLRPWNLSRTDVGRITQPGLVVHAKRDPYIGAPLMRATAEQFDNLVAYKEIDCGHFVQRDKPTTFNRLLVKLFETAEAEETVDAV